MDKATVVCSSCHSTVPKGKFCIQCGFSFEKKKCSNCNQMLDGGAFCKNCGLSAKAQEDGVGSGVAVGHPVMMPSYNAPTQNLVAPHQSTTANQPLC